MRARDQRIVIYRRNVTGQNSIGEDVLGSPTQVASLAARVEFLIGRELQAAQQKWAEARYRIRIPYQPEEIKREYWISWNGRTLDILDVQGYGSRGLEWVLIAKDHVE